MRYLALILILTLTACAAPPTPPTPATSGPTLPTSEPALTVSMTIIDDATSAPVKAAIFVDQQRVAADVTEATISVPADGQRHTIRVEALDYQVWSIDVAGEAQAGRRISGPVRLKRKP